jgi:hypothetical protein
MLRPSNNGNGLSLEPRRFRVPFNKGDYVVVVDEFAEEVDGPHKMDRSGYKYGIEGRRTVHTFNDYDLAMRFAEDAVERLSEEQGEDS